MGFADDIRDVGRARALSAQIGKLCRPGRAYRLLDAAGGHSHSDYGRALAGYLPDAVSLTSGPGCPVCVLPGARAGEVRRIAEQSGVVVASFASTAEAPHVPVAGVKRVHSPLDALTIARHNGDLRVVFWAVGYETTTASTAVSLIRAIAEGVRNFSVLCDHHRLVPTLAGAVAAQPIDGVIAPAEVATVIGGQPFTAVGRPVVVSGPEPLDVLQAVVLLMRQVHDGRREVESATRTAAWDGNRVAQRAIGQVLMPSGDTSMRVRPELSAYDEVVPAR